MSLTTRIALFFALHAVALSVPLTLAALQETSEDTPGPIAADTARADPDVVLARF